MNILLVNYEYPPFGGGAANATFFLARALAAKGQEVVVLTSGTKGMRGYSFANGIHVHRVWTCRRALSHSNVLEMASFLLSGTLSATKIARSHNVDKMIVFFSLPCGPLGYFLKKRLNIPYVVSLRGGDVPGFEAEVDTLHKALTFVRRAVLRRATRVVATSSGLAELSRRADPIPVGVIRNGVDVEFFRPKGPPEEPGAGRVAFIFVGRFHPQKNLFFLLDRIAELQSTNDRAFVFHFVGDGPQMLELQKYGGKLGVQDQIVWHGWVDKERLRSLYQSSHCLVNTSPAESFPNSILEGMACGLPVIAGNVPGLNEMIKPGETGYLCNFGCPSEFTLALQEVLNDPEKTRQTGRAARGWVQDLSWDRVADEFLGLF
jgi:glycosyltransferase involved in cell wall biosynthesis